MTTNDSTTFPAADLDRRFYAFVLDRLVAWTVYAGAALAAYFVLIEPGNLWAGVGVVVGAVLIVGLASSVLLGLRGTSPGRAVLGLRVVRADGGGPIGVPTALLRALVLGAAALPTFGLGIATLAWTAAMDRSGQRRGWHDHLCHSVVVDVRPVPVVVEVVDPGPRAVVNLTAMRLVPAPPPPSPPPPPPASPPASRPRSADRTVARSPGSAPSLWRVSFDSGETFVVEGLALVGRRPEPRAGEPVRHLIPLRSGDMSLSKTHAQFQVAPDGVLVVMDRGSTNGTVLTRQGISRSLGPGRPTTLVDGDLVRFGDRQMTVARVS
ncbi:RDD family protein [Nocardioides sp.]|uniref:RDD family protein n=1 Tax=Nocardioides sp. TaxID=35761 RepID=UPI0031FEC448|nr:putative rane protein YckC, family [Nocardioides sp.]